jgi:hypothetical protein
MMCTVIVSNTDNFYTDCKLSRYYEEINYTNNWKIKKRFKSIQSVVCGGFDRPPRAQYFMCDWVGRVCMKCALTDCCQKLVWFIFANYDPISKFDQ